MSSSACKPFSNITNKHRHQPRLSRKPVRKISRRVRSSSPVLSPLQVKNEKLSKKNLELEAFQMFTKIYACQLEPYLKQTAIRKMLKELWSHKLKKSSKLAFIKHLLRQNKTATALVNDQINETQEDNEENEDVAFYAMDEHCRLLSKEKNTEHTESLFYLTRIIEYLKRNVKPKEDLSSSSHNRLLRRSSRVKRHLYRCQCCQNLDENGEYENHENKQLEEFIQKYLNFDQKQGSTRQSQTLPIISNELAQIAVISLVTKNDLKMDFDLPQSLLSSIENQLCSTLIEPTSPTSNPSSFFQNLAATTMATLREQNPSSFLDTILDANDGGDDLLAETLPSAQDFDFLQNDFDFGISNETIADFDQFMEHLQLQDPEQEHQQQQESESDQYFIETMVNEPIFGHFKVELCIRV